jgi:hypothetical protein
MRTFKLVGAAMMLSALAASPALAQAAIQEPGAYAFYHPNGDLGLGSRPAEGMALSPPRNGEAMAQMRMVVRPQVRQYRHSTR